MSSGDNISGDVSQDDAYHLDRKLVAQVQESMVLLKLEYMQSQEH